MTDEHDFSERPETPEMPESDDVRDDISDEMPVDEKPKNTPPDDDSPARFRWYQVWAAVLSRPATDTFEIILDDPAANSNRAVSWVFTSSLVTFAGMLLFLLLRFRLPFEPAFLIQGAFFAIATTVGFVLNAYFIQMCAKLTGGQGSYEQFQYAFAAFDAPLRIIGAIVAMLAPQSVVFVLAIAVYRLILLGMAIRAVNGVSWARAILVLVVAVVLSSAIATLIGLLLASVFQSYYFMLPIL